MSLPNAAAACRAPALRAKLDAGAHIEERDVKGRTALFRAARVGRLENIVLLLERGADPNAKDNTDEAPLQAAARYGYLECVRALIEAGARINDFPDPAKTEYSETALCSAVRRKFSEVAEFLLGAGADPNAASSSERLPLHEAAGSGNLPLCRALVAAGANLKTTVKWRGTPLHFAVSCSKVEAVRELIQLGADVNARDLDGRTPLMSAVLSMEHSVPLVFEILKAKPDLRLRDGKGETALDLALWQEKKEVVDILDAAGAPGTETQESMESESVIKIAPGVEVVLEVGTFHVPVEKKDEALATELPATPNLVGYLGWRSSTAHWRLLEGSRWTFAAGTRTPYSIERLAYFARGYCNRPAGTELDDGPKLLGERYEKAVERFLTEGLFCIVEPRETLLTVATVPELKAIGANLGVKAKGKKVEVLDELLAHCGADPFREILLRNRLYVVTDAGRSEFDNKAKHLAQAKARLQSEIIEAFADGALLWGLSLFQNLMAVEKTFRPLSPRCICKARLVLENAVPPEIDFSENDLAMLRAVAAFKMLDWSREDVWPANLRERAPSLENMKLTPDDFGKSLISGEAMVFYRGEDESDD
jgi:ankyrin repeat protein